MTVPRRTDGRRLARGPILAVVATVAAAGLLAAGWFLAAAFESPAQREASSLPPAPKPVTATVERGDLRETVSFRATVQRQDSSTVAFPAQTADDPIVTARPIDTGHEITAGTVVSEVVGRPVIALPGSFPYYRSLQPGDTGPDVRQLQSGLTAAGHPVRLDGSFGAATARAVHALYQSAGYATPASDTANREGEQPPADPSAGATGTAGTDPSAGAAATSRLTLPRSELAVFPSLPATLTALPAVGSAAETAFTIERGTPRLSASVPQLVAQRLAVGTAGTFTGPQSQRIAVHVDEVGGSGDDDAGAAESSVLLSSDAEPIPAEWLGAEGTASMELRLAAEDALLVPTIAVAPGGKGSAHVRVRSPDGTFHRIAVTEEAQLDGRSAIHAEDDDALHAGDVVRID